MMTYRQLLEAIRRAKKREAEENEAFLESLRNGTWEHDRAGGEGRLKTARIAFDEEI